MTFSLHGFVAGVAGVLLDSVGAIHALPYDPWRALLRILCIAPASLKQSATGDNGLAH